jgi:diguanylate cyclase (GGDEF)-like protein
MNIGHFRLRSLTTLVSLAGVGLFLCFYLAFNYYWTHDNDVRNARMLQQAEISRVKTIFDMKSAELISWTSDYSAWNELIDFIDQPFDEFKQDSINIHTLTSNQLDSFLIFNPQERLVWSLTYDYQSDQTSGAEALLSYMAPILQQLEQLQNQQVEPFVQFMAIQNSPYLVAASRVCNSNGEDCNYGSLIFVKKLRQEFIDEINQATGVSVDLLVVANDVQPPVSANNISYVPITSYPGQPYLWLKINHVVTLPAFLDWQEITALGLFSLFMFVTFHTLANLVVKPVIEASQLIRNFKHSGGKMPEADSFLSKEMREFAQNMNEVIGELESSRAELEWQSQHDPLTRIANRRRLENKITQIIEQQQVPYLMVFLIDIDHFKRYNDHYGHIMGDVALQSVAKALDELPFDGEKIVSRFGGEEFCVVCGSDNLQDANQYARQLRQAIVDLHIEHDLSPTKPILSISIGGVNIVGPVLANYLSYFHHADAALYQAKDQGRDQWYIKTYHYRHNPHMDNQGLDSIR